MEKHNSIWLLAPYAAPWPTGTFENLNRLSVLIIFFGSEELESLRSSFAMILVNETLSFFNRFTTSSICLSDVLLFLVVLAYTLLKFPNSNFHSQRLLS